MFPGTLASDTSSGESNSARNRTLGYANQTERLLFAKKLLQETGLGMFEVALRRPAPLANPARRRFMNHIYSTEIESPLGTITLRGTERGLTGLYMQNHRHGPEEFARRNWQRNDEHFAAARAQLGGYFAGKRKVFTLPIDREAMGGTEFQRRVWAGLEAIPFGVTISYGELARRIDHPAAVRAVGLANGRNPLSIIVPCHRVIGANGKLTGYGGGIERKRLLLELEKSGLG